MDEPINLDEIRHTWPYMEKTCALCAWALPMIDTDDRCRYFGKEVDPQQPACDYFVNRYVEYWL